MSGSCLFDDFLEAFAHDVLEGHALADDVAAVTAVEQRLLDPGKATAQQADDQVVGHIGLGLVRAASVVLLQQRDQAI
jgi:hypothetical protein